MKLFQKKTGRLSAAEARAIPIGSEYLDPIMEKIYRSIRFAASHGENKIWHYYLGHPENTRNAIKQQLELDGYKVCDTREKEFVRIGEWLISWEED